MNDDQRRVTAAVEAEARAVRCALTGQRHETLVRAAYSLGILGDQALLSRDHAFEALEEAAAIAGMNSGEIYSAFAAGWESGLTAASVPAEQTDYLAESARILRDLNAAAGRYSNRVYPKSDAYGNRWKIYLEHLKDVAEAYERLGALQRGIAPTGYMASTRMTRELAEEFGRPKPS